MDATLPFHLQQITLANGIEGRVTPISSFNVLNYENIIKGVLGDAVTLHAQIFVPVAAKPFAAVIIVPGSGGVNPAMLAHAQKLTDAGIAACVLDPFTGRSVINTIAVQEQFSFAASSYDVFACIKFLNTQADIDPQRIGAIGYSRGGTAVTQAAMSQLASPALGKLPHLRASLAAWPWHGFQFSEPSIGKTALRFVAADSDQWASIVQCQAYFNAIKARNPSASVSLRLVKDAHHGFGYGIPEKQWPEAMKAMHAPIVYFGNDGVMQDVWTSEPRPSLDDKAIIAQLAGYISRGVTVGSKDGQMADFMQDFTAFFSENLLNTS